MRFAYSRKHKLSYKVLWEYEGFKIITEGIFGNDFLDASIKATTDPRFIDAKYAIVNFLNVDTFPIESNIIRQIAESDTRAYKVNPKMKLAVLSNKLVMAGIVNMYITYFELNNNEQRWELEIFETVDEARKWINS